MSSLRRSTQLRRGKRIKPMSDRRDSERDERRELCARVLARDRYECQAKALVPEISCGGRLDVDEIILRSSWRAGYLIDANCQALCRAHHDWKHTHPDAARELGLRLYSWERELLPG